MLDRQGVSADIVPVEAAEFAAFYSAVHGHGPFPWQQELVDRVLADRRWPELIDVPTGLGKTSMLDVAVFVTAACAGEAGQERLGRRRCFFVVDRRIVVDEAYEHAQRIATVLEQAERRGDDTVAARIAQCLRSYAPAVTSRPVLSVTRMRGGVTWASAWLERPDVPGIVLGTVDQVGSRLLFRGYGVSDRRRPVDAALVGTDALLLVDEAHLSTALLTTVRAAQDRDRLDVPVPGLSVVQLSATAEAANPERLFGLDLDAHREHPVAWRRLTAGKRLHLLSAAGRDGAKAMADVAVEQCRALGATTEGGAPTVLVVCNTVDRARAVHGLLLRQLAGKGVSVEGDCELLIGRARPIDRPDLQRRILNRFGIRRTANHRSAFLVATQTVEVGVNLDVDVLVTESASWDALVQRLGRVNRLGMFPSRFSARTVAPAVVVHDGQDNGPVYGAARDVTWQALTGLVAHDGDGIDVSPLACRQLSAEALGDPRCVRRSAEAPVLLRTC